MRILLQSFSFKERTSWYNLGLPYLHAALLTDPRLTRETEVRIVQSDIFDETGPLVREIEAFRPDLVGLSVYMWSADLTAGLIRACDALPHPPLIVCGGTGLLHRERAFLEANPACDAVVHGMGEAALVELTRHLLDGDGRLGRPDAIGGLSYRDQDGLIRSTPPREGQLPLARLPSPYRSGLCRPDGFLMIETERYCPFRCSYCTWAHQGLAAADRRLPLDSLREEIRWASANGYRNVEFIDSAINYDTERFCAILDIIDRHGDTDGGRYFFFINLDLLNGRQVRRLLAVRRSVMIFLGVESFSPEALKAVGRRPSPGRLMPVIEALSLNPHITLMVGLVLGFPKDSLDTLLQGVEVLHRRENIHTRLSLLTAPFGTRLERQAGQLGMRFQPEGIPYLIGSPEFPEEAVARADDHCNRLSRTSGRISFNTLQVPIRRLINRAIIPERLTSSSPEDWVPVSVRKITCGTVEGISCWEQLVF